MGANIACLFPPSSWFVPIELPIKQLLIMKALFSQGIKERKASRTLFEKSRLVGWVLMKTKVKGIKLDRTEMNIYKNWYI